MEKIVLFGWVFYLEKDGDFDKEKCGKWMFFFNKDEVEKVDEICKKAVEQGVVKECKYSDVINFPKKDGVSCFYLNCDDEEGHKKVITYFLNNNLIPRTKSGKLYNISFKKDTQTRAKEYGDKFSSDIKLEQFIDLNTGEWIK